MEPLADMFQHDKVVAGFADGGSDAITVEPTSGTLNRRSGEPQEFVIKFQPTAFAPSYEAKLVIETESVKWTYDVVCQLEKAPPGASTRARPPRVP